MDVDFGTYHHSTPQESERIREDAEKAFSKLLRPLYPSRAALSSHQPSGIQGRSVER
jgi:hypothetical protein